MIETERWDEPRKLALRIRLRPDVADRLRAYSYFLEGRVEIAQNRPGVAAQLFAQVPACPTDNLFPTQREHLKRLRQILDEAPDPEPSRVAAIH